MRAVSWQGGLVLLSAALLSAWWWRRDAAPSTPPEARTVRTASPSAGPAVPAGAVGAGPVGRLPGVVPPSLASSTPAERAAMVDAEVERSAAAPPVGTYEGEDGRRHAFAYGAAPAQALAQRDEDARRAAALDAMRADPAGFAARHGLRPRDVERMLDGSLEIPEPMLD